MMKNTLIAALIATLPALAQEAPQPEATPAAPQPRHWGAGGMMPGRNMSEEDRAAMREEMQRRMMERFDTDRDGQISAEERAAAHAEMNNRRPQGPEGNVHPGNRRRPHSERPEMIERFDTDGDGQLSPEEHEALRAAAQNRRGERAQRGPRGERPEGNVHPGNRRRPHGERPEMIERFDTDGDGQLSEAEREAARTAVQGRRGERGQRGPRRRQRPEGQRPMPQAPGADVPTTLEL